MRRMPVALPRTVLSIPSRLEFQIRGPHIHPSCVVMAASRASFAGSESQASIQSSKRALVVVSYASSGRDRAGTKCA